MSIQRVALHFKRTDKIAPKDGQECLVFNPCDGYRVAEWYEPGGCFLEHEETLSSALAVMWMELPDQVESDNPECAKLDVISVEINQTC